MKKQIARWLVVSVLMGGTAWAQQAPTMAQTKAWLESEGVELMSAVKETPTNKTIMVNSGLKLQDCRLSFRTDFSSWTESSRNHYEFQNRFEVPLKDVNLTALVVKPEDNGLALPTSVFIETRQPTIHIWTDKYPSNLPSTPPEEMGRYAGLYMSAADAPRVLKAIKRAATLCGATGSAF